MFVPLYCAVCFERGLELSHRRVSKEDEAKNDSRNSERLAPRRARCLPKFVTQVPQK